MNHRIGALAGFAFLLIGLVGFGVAPPPPVPDAETTEWIRWYTENPGGIQAYAYLSGVTILALLVWFGGLRAHVWRGADAAPLAPIATIGLSVLATGLLIGVGTSSAIAMRIDELGDDVVLFGSIVGGVMVGAAEFGVAALMGAVSAEARRRGSLPNWLVLLGVVGAVVAMGAAAGVATDGDFVTPAISGSWLIMTVWIVATSVVMWKGSSDSAGGERETDGAIGQRAPATSALGG